MFPRTDGRGWRLGLALGAALGAGSMQLGCNEPPPPPACDDGNPCTDDELSADACKFAVNETTVYGQHSPDLVFDGTSLWAAWEDDSQMATSGCRRACFRQINAVLVPLGAEACESGTLQVNGRIAMTVAGGSVARVWRRDVAGASTLEVRWTGHAWTESFVIEPDAWESPALVELDAEHILVVYAEGSGDLMGLVARSDGSSATAFALQAGREPSLAATPDGVYLAWREVGTATAWLDETYITRLGWDGTTLSAGGEIWPVPHVAAYQIGDQTRPQLAGSAIGASGALWAAWNDLQVGQDPEHGDVRVSLMMTPIVGEGLAW